MFNRNLVLLLLTNIILGASMPMLIIVGGLSGALLASSSTLATAALSVQMLAGIVVASPLSLFMGAAGRKAGFLLAAAAMTLGGALATIALFTNSFFLLCVAHFFMGAALIGVNFLRFAASEVVPEQWRAQAVSYMLASGLIAALVGPAIFDAASDWLLPVDFAGVYAAIALVGVIGALPVMGLSGIRQAAIGPQHVEAQETSPVVRKTTGKTSPVVADEPCTESHVVGGESRTPTDAVRGLQLIASRASLRIAITAAVVSQAVMILLMVPTSLAMVGHGYPESHAADVIRWHVVAMFAPGLFTGTLIARIGVLRVITAGFVMLMAAAIIAMMYTSLFSFYLALVLLGVGWNFGFVGGTFLLQASLSAAEKPLVQGINDTLMATASAVASVVSGALFATLGWSQAAVVVAPLMVIAVQLLVQPVRQYRLEQHTCH